MALSPIREARRDLLKMWIYRRDGTNFNAHSPRRLIDPDPDEEAASMGRVVMTFLFSLSNFILCDCQTARIIRP